MAGMETIYREYKEKVFGYLLHRVGDPVTAEDLCSDVFVKVMEKLSEYDPQKAGLSTWIYCITRNTLFDYYRTAHACEELDTEVPASEDFVEKLCTDEMLDLLADALHELPAREREILVRRYYNGETLKEIGARLGISYAYVRVLHQNALGKMKKYFEKRGAL